MTPLDQQGAPQETLHTVRAVCEAKGVDDASKVSVIWGLVALVPDYHADEWEVRRRTDSERYNRRCEAEAERRAEAANADLTDDDMPAGGAGW